MKSWCLGQGAAGAAGAAWPAPCNNPTPLRRAPQPRPTVGLGILAQQRQVGRQVRGHHAASTQLGEDEAWQAAAGRQIQAPLAGHGVGLPLKELGEHDG